MKILTLNSIIKKQGNHQGASFPLEVLQLITDPQIIRLVEHISEHYRANISNRFIRPALLQLPLEKQCWDLIETLTEKVEQFRYQGFHIDELYRQIIACARFVSLCRRDLVPILRNRLNIGGSTGSDRVLQDMAINNFGSNLQLFADLVNELFINLVDIDKRDAKGRRPLYMDIPELQEIGRLLIGH